jgi:sugar lactone lactonase YvrE
MMSHRFGKFIAAGFTVLAALSPAMQAEDYAISTFAGTGLVAGGADGRPGTFNAPYGIAIDGAKTLYVTDTVNNTIRKITPAGVVSTLAGSAGLIGSTNGTGAAARFNFPVGIGVDAGGNVYVSDSKNFIIRKITPAGEVSTFAGAPSQLGSTDGTGSAARFFLPSGLAVDSAGNVYVAEQGNHLIRKITPGGVVSTLAGGVQQPGFADGNGTAARFNMPFGLAIDASGNVLVADAGNNAIRRVSPSGVVTTVAGATTAGAIDGASGAARFNQPRGVSVDSGGNLYVADYGNQLLRYITTGGVVSSLAGTAGVPGTADSVGASARFYDPVGVVADGTAVFVVDSSNNLIRRGVPASTAGLPVISIQPLDQEVSTGQSVSFRVVVSGNALTYQWLKNSVAIPGATNATYTIGSAQTSDVGVFSVRISSAGGSVDSGPGTLSVTTPGSGPIIIISRPLSQHVEVGQAVSFSITASGSGLTYQWQKNGANIPGGTSATYSIASAQTSDVAIYSVRVTSGAASESATARLLVGAAAGGITFLSQPSSVTVSAGQPAGFSVTASGTGLSYQWLKNGNAIAGENGPSYTIASASAGDAGTYAVRITAGATTVNSASATLTVNQTVPDGPTSRLVNLSVRTAMAASQTLIMGFTVQGGGAKPVLLRAVGPGLAQFGVGGVMSDPRLALFRDSTQLEANDNWGGGSALSTAFASVGAFALPPTSLDAALLRAVDGGHTAQVTGTGAGVVLVEAYDVGTGSTPRLVNVSARNRVGTGDDILIAGFTVGGTGTMRLLVRAVGPKLTTFGVGDVLVDPKLEIYNSSGVKLTENDNWAATLAATFTAVGAFPLDPASRDAALLADLPVGSYTAQVSGIGGGVGEALVEIYEVR